MTSKAKVFWFLLIVAAALLVLRNLASVVHVTIEFGVKQPDVLRIEAPAPEESILRALPAPSKRSASSGPPRRSALRASVSTKPFISCRSSSRENQPGVNGKVPAGRGVAAAACRATPVATGALSPSKGSRA